MAEALLQSMQSVRVLGGRPRKRTHFLSDQEIVLIRRECRTRTLTEVARAHGLSVAYVYQLKNYHRRINMQIR